ncbi:MAG TPA: MFS transporter [Pyrinomonadaceae bacterium]|nr:MFS transporter [Pyrinomonadaceae bacterium]
MVENERDAEPLYDSEISLKGSQLTGLWRRYRGLPRNIFAISLVSLLNDASSEIIYPLLPMFLSLTLGASPAVIGLIEGAAESVSSLLKLFAGYFSDRRGKRKIFVVLGYGVTNLVRPLLAFATTWYQVLAIRLTDRAGKGVRSAPRDAMIADSVSPDERGLAFGFHRAMDHTGAVVGPLAGFLLVWLLANDRDNLTSGDFTNIFLLASIPALAAIVVVAFFVRETAVPRNANNIHPAAPVSLSLKGFDKNFKRFLVILALFTLSNSSDAFLLLRAQSAGVSAGMIPLLWALLHVVKVVSSLFGGDLSDRLGRQRLIVAGWILYAAVYLGFAFVSQEISVWILFLIYGIYFGLVEGAEKALVADLVRPEQRGTAYGLYNLAFGITVLPASLFMGVLWSVSGPAIAFTFSSMLGLSAAIMLSTTVRSRPQNADVN